MFIFYLASFLVQKLYASPSDEFLIFAVDRAANLMPKCNEKDINQIFVAFGAFNADLSPHSKYFVVFLLFGVLYYFNFRALMKCLKNALPKFSPGAVVHCLWSLSHLSFSFENERWITQLSQRILGPFLWFLVFF